MGSHNKRTLHALGAEAKEVHEIVLGYTVVTWAGHRATADLHLHSSIAGLGKRVHNEDPLEWEGVYAAETLARPVVLEVRAGLQDLPEGIRLSAAVRIDGLCKSLVGELADRICCCHEGLERDRSRGLLVPEQTSRRRLILIAVVAEQSLQSILGKEDGDFKPISCSPIAESAECVGFTRSA